jgi:hypothetical protein
MLEALYCNNKGDWREVDAAGYAAAYFRGWKVRPPAREIEHPNYPERGRCVVTGTRRVAGENWLFLCNEHGEFDTMLE